MPGRLKATAWLVEQSGNWNKSHSMRFWTNFLINDEKSLKIFSAIGFPRYLCFSKKKTFNLRKNGLNCWTSCTGIWTCAHSFVTTLKPETSLEALKFLKTFPTESLLKPSSIASKQSTHTPPQPSTQFSLKPLQSPKSSGKITNDLFAFHDNLSQFISVTFSETFSSPHYSADISAFTRSRSEPGRSTCMGQLRRQSLSLLTLANKYLRFRNFLRQWKIFIMQIIIQATLRQLRFIALQRCSIAWLACAFHNFRTLPAVSLAWQAPKRVCVTT